MIKISKGGQLEKWRQFTKYIQYRGLHHKRQPWACFPAISGKTPNWYRRKVKKRHEKRMKRLEAMWAKFKKPPRLTEKQIKVKQTKEFIEELFRRIKVMTPYYRMKQRSLSISGINAFEVLDRKLDIKKRILERHLAEQRFLLSQLSFLKSSSMVSDINKKVLIVDELTKLKIKWTNIFKVAIFHRKVINRKLSEKRKYFMNILIPLGEHYYKERKFATVKVPKYLQDFDKFVYNEKCILPKKTVEQKLLQVFAMSQMKYMKLKETAEELALNIRTRYYFTAGVSKVLNELNYAKDIVLDLLQEGHEILTKMFHFHDAFKILQGVQDRLRRVFERRRLRANYKYRMLETEVEFLLQRHNIFHERLACFSTFFHEQDFSPIRREDYVKILEDPIKAYKMLEKREYGEARSDLALNMWDGFTGLFNTWKSNALQGTLTLINNLNIIGSDYIQCLISFAEEKSLRDFVSYYCHFSTVAWLKVCCLLLYKKCMKPFASNLDSQALVHLFHAYEDRKNYLLAVRDIFQLTKRNTKYLFRRLGVHHKMVRGNKDQCLKTEFKYFRLFLALKNSLLDSEEKRKWAIIRTRRESSKKQNRFNRFIIPKKENNYNLQGISIYQEEFETLCPLCCSAERSDLLKRIGENHDFMKTLDEIRNESEEYFFGVGLTELKHDILHCKQPAATFFLKIKILEDRRKLSHFGDSWKNF